MLAARIAGRVLSRVALFAGLGFLVGISSGGVAGAICGGLLVLLTPVLDVMSNHVLPSFPQKFGDVVFFKLVSFVGCSVFGAIYGMFVGAISGACSFALVGAWFAKVLNQKHITTRVSELCVRDSVCGSLVGALCGAFTLSLWAWMFHLYFKQDLPTTGYFYGATGGCALGIFYRAVSSGLLSAKIEKEQLKLESSTRMETN